MREPLLVRPNTLPLVGVLIAVVAALASSPAEESSLLLDMPPPTPGTYPRSPPPPILVVLAEDGRVNLYGAEQMSRREALERAASSARDGRAVTLMADDDVPYIQVYRTAADLKALGADVDLAPDYPVPIRD